MDSANFNKAILANRAWQASHDDALQGLLVECFIIKNRVDAGWGTWRSMIQKADQWAGNVPGQVYDAPSDVDPLFRRLLSSIDSIYDGTRDDDMTRITSFDGKRVHGLFYADLAKPLNPWFQKNILGDPENHKRIAIVGRLTIFS
jgi:hypothetical protein